MFGFPIPLDAAQAQARPTQGHEPVRSVLGIFKCREESNERESKVQGAHPSLCHVDGEKKVKRSRFL